MSDVTDMQRRETEKEKKVLKSNAILSEYYAIFLFPGRYFHLQAHREVLFMHVHHLYTKSLK